MQQRWWDKRARSGVSYGAVVLLVLLGAAAVFVDSSIGVYRHKYQVTYVLLAGLWGLVVLIDHRRQRRASDL